MKKLLVLTASVLLFLGWKVYASEEYNAPVGHGTPALNADYGGVDIMISTFTINTSTVGLGPVGPGGYGQPGSYQAFATTFTNFPQGTYGYYASTTVPNLKTAWRVYGAYFSTGSCGANDFIDVFTSTGGMSSVNTSAPLRYYNTQGSTATVGNTNATSCSGFNWTRWPIRLYGNLYFRPSVATYNSVGLLYWKEPD